jgi:hypothetical protein
VTFSLEYLFFDVHRTTSVGLNYCSMETEFYLKVHLKYSKHNNPLHRVAPIENLNSLPPYDKEKYKEMILDAAETVLGFFGFDRTAHGAGSFKKNRKLR